MTVTVKLPKTLEDELRRKAEASGTPISDLARDAIAERLARVANHKRSLRALDDTVIGCIDSGRDDRSERVEERVAEVVDEKHHRRRRPAHRAVRSSRQAP
jgi:hypothetical protein